MTNMCIILPRQTSRNTLEVHPYSLPFLPSKIRQSPSRTEALHALPNVSAAILKSNGIKAFGIARSVVQNYLSHGLWGTVPIHYKVLSTWTQSHLLLVLSHALFWLSWDGSWGTVGAQSNYPKKLQICYQVSHSWYSCFLATASLPHWNTIRKLFWFWFFTCLLMQKNWLKQSTWRNSEWPLLDLLYQFIWCKYQF